MSKNIKNTLALITKICEDNKADDIQQYDVQKKSSITDYYLICSGHSIPHIKAIQEKVNLALRTANITICRIDNSPNSRWVIMDLGSIIFHIFHPQVRTFYAIEEIWKAKMDFTDQPWTCPDDKVLRHTLDDIQDGGTAEQSFFKD